MRELRSHGVTLIELVVVIAILGVVALVAIPNLFSGDVKRLDVAASEVAAALRYARSEALRSGEVHGVEINHATQRVVAYKADLSTEPVGMALILTHPVDRKPYDFDFDTAVMTSGVSIGNFQKPFQFFSGREMSVLFNASGLPIWIDSTTSTTYPLLDGMVELDYGAQQRTVRVALTGRVTIE